MERLLSKQFHLPRTLHLTLHLIGDRPADGAFHLELRRHAIGHAHAEADAELAVVIGRRMRNVTPAAAARYIFGYTAAEDISDRTIQNAESQWARAKSFDTFTPLGPYVETKIDPHDLTIQLFQNGQLRADMLVRSFSQVINQRKAISSNIYCGGGLSLLL